MCSYSTSERREGWSNPFTGGGSLLWMQTTSGASSVWSISRTATGTGSTAEQETAIWHTRGRFTIFVLAKAECCVSTAPDLGRNSTTTNMPAAHVETTRPFSIPASCMQVVLPAFPALLHRFHNRRLRVPFRITGLHESPGDRGSVNLSRLGHGKHRLSIKLDDTTPKS